MIQEHIRQIGRFYRSPGSAGYHAAIDYVIDRLQQNDIQFTVHEYPLDGVSKVRGERTPLAWEPQGGVLEMVSPTSQTLVRWEECASCLPWWCPATPPGGIDLELVDVGTGTDDEAYLGREVQGKAVLVHDAKENFAWSDIVARAKRHNVAGLITNYLLYQYAPWRTRATLPEAVQQLRLPSVRENPWTFTVSQPAFECLETALAQGAVKPVVRFSVSARTFEGTSRSVLATIPGEIAASPSSLCRTCRRRPCQVRTVHPASPCSSNSRGGSRPGSPLASCLGHGAASTSCSPMRVMAACISRRSTPRCTRGQWPPSRSAASATIRV